MIVALAFLILLCALCLLLSISILMLAPEHDLAPDDLHLFLDLVAASNFRLFSASHQRRIACSIASRIPPIIIWKACLRHGGPEALPLLARHYLFRLKLSGALLFDLWPIQETLEGLIRSCLPPART